MARPIDAVLYAVASSNHDAVAIPSILRYGQLGTHAKQYGQRRTGKDASPLPIDAILHIGAAVWNHSSDGELQSSPTLGNTVSADTIMSNTSLTRFDTGPLCGR